MKFYIYFAFLTHLTLTVQSQWSYAVYDTIPLDIKAHLFNFLELKDLPVMSSVSKECQILTQDVVRRKYLKKIKAIMKEQRGKFIPLPRGGSISSVGVSQALWVAVMGNNPSRFQTHNDCPDSYREEVINNKVVGMCSDFPVENITAVDQGYLTSDVEFIKNLNTIYKIVGLNVKFRRSTKAEFFWADSANGKDPKPSTQAEIQKFIPFNTGKTRAFSFNAPNDIGFQRSGVFEWTEDLEWIPKQKQYGRLIVGGGYKSEDLDQQKSGYSNSILEDRMLDVIGAGRLVKEQVSESSSRRKWNNFTRFFKFKR